MHFIAFTCREWKPNSLGRYGTNSSANKTGFVTAMFAPMFIRLIIQNRFHFLLKDFSIWNSLSDVLSAPLFVATISVHLCCLRRWISSRRSSLQRILPLRGLTIRRSCVCCSVCMRNGLRFTDSKHCFADDENTALHECFGHLWLISVDCWLETKMRRDVNYCMTS